MRPFTLSETPIQKWKNEMQIHKDHACHTVVGQQSKRHELTIKKTQHVFSILLSVMEHCRSCFTASLVFSHLWTGELDSVYCLPFSLHSRRARSHVTAAICMCMTEMSYIAPSAVRCPCMCSWIPLEVLRFNGSNCLDNHTF